MIRAACVNGKHIARFCAIGGNSLSGKKVPAKINIGFMNRKNGMLNQSIEGVYEVSISPIPANINPIGIATTGISNAPFIEIKGRPTKYPIDKIANVIRAALVTDFVVDHINSAISTSDAEAGVAAIACQVF